MLDKRIFSSRKAYGTGWQIVFLAICLIGAPITGIAQSRGIGLQTIKKLDTLPIKAGTYRA